MELNNIYYISFVLWYLVCSKHPFTLIPNGLTIPVRHLVNPSYLQCRLTKIILGYVNPWFYNLRQTLLMSTVL